jgi:hypothetical protein
MQCLSLEVRDFESATRYRWALVGPSGELMAEHRVQLDARSPEYEAFTNLHGHLDWRAVPEPRTRIRHLDEARITGEIGKWIGTQVLGPVGTAIAAAAPTPGGGKTACAVELAYTHEHAFERMAWFKVSDAEEDQDSTLLDFAETLESALPGLHLADLVGDPARLAAFAPEITGMMSAERVLIIVDNVESLLTESGEWRHQPWRQVINALTAHQGSGRVLLTSRRRPVGLQVNVRVETVDVLSSDEALLLASQLPGLRQLIDGGPADARQAVARLVRRALELAQGHPKLLELANGQAADPVRLRELIAVGDTAWSEQGGVPAGFFATATGRAAGTDYLHVLEAWTGAVEAGLTAGDRDLLTFLCCVEETDRVRFVVEDTWARNQTAGGENLDTRVARLSTAGLLSVQGRARGNAQFYEIHPVVASVTRARAGTDYRVVVDARLAAYWEQACRNALGSEGAGGTSQQVARTGIAAIPYLLRQDKPLAAGELLEEVLQRDGSRRTALMVRPVLTAIALVATGPAKAIASLSLLRVLDAIGIGNIDSDPSLPLIFNAVADPASFWELSPGTLSTQDYRAFKAMAALLFKLALLRGDYAEAEQIARDEIRVAGRLGMGPWTRLDAQVARLEVEATRDLSGRVLPEVTRLVNHMKTLRASSRQPEAAIPWRVRERLLTIGGHAATNAERWQEALNFNAALIASMRARGAADRDLVGALFSGHGPLMMLDRHAQARRVLQQCRDLAEADHDFRMLGPVLSAQAAVEDMLGHPGIAVELARTALRYEYRAFDVDGIPISHYRLARSSEPSLPYWCETG